MVFKYKRWSIQDICRFVSEIKHLIPEERKGRGKPRTYSECVILALFICKTLNNWSYRELLFFARRKFRRLPALSTLHYRFKKISPELLESIFQYVRQRLLGILKPGFRYLFVDGTGFGYSGTKKIKWKRGKETREVSPHVKTVIFVGRAGNLDVVLEQSANFRNANNHHVRLSIQ